MGLNLGRLTQKRSFTPKETLAVTIQTRLHDKGWLHCNASGNFVVGPSRSDTKGRIFVIDFEYVRRASTVPKFEHTTNGRNQNFHHCSGVRIKSVYSYTAIRAMHFHLPYVLDPTYQDDLEGLGYVFSFLEKGELPWSYLCNLKGLSSDSYLVEVHRRKLTTLVSKLFQGMDPVYVRYFSAIKCLAWDERPDYGAMIKDFMGVWVSRNYDCTPYEIDWCTDFDDEDDEN
ncbi:hypothetical protein M422DRAFT_241117 [Sphaerobolus stellatus SS14]|nr:hypothetical protein M422DRAFT_241117 [Sphaerobolus stellatus SS14]